MTLPSEASAISPGRSDHPAAANPPAESMVIESIVRAHGLGCAGLTNLAIAHGCPSLRLDYLQRAAERISHASDVLTGAIAAQKLRNAAGEPDCDDGTPIISSATNEAGKIIEPQPGPSIRCNDCYAPADCDCAECRARNADRDAAFAAPTSARSAEAAE
jgi:hypothetical protein